MKPLTVLLADDSDEFRETLSAYLKNQPGIEIVGEAASGLEALYKANALRPEVILLDISMAGISGFEVARLLKEYLPNMVIVFLTVHEAPVYLSLAETVGVHGFVQKPLVKQELLLTLQRIQREKPGKVFAPLYQTAAAR